jgi:hypothetical protein
VYDAEGYVILNAYAVLAGFTSLLRLGLGVLLVALALTAWLRGRAASATSEPSRREDRFYLVFLIAAVLLVVNVASWPLFYLLLDSYIPEWPGVMCIYGVTQVGAHSAGPSRFLPDLVALLQVMKPCLVFLSGGWVVLHLINRRTATAPLTGRVIVVLGLVGTFAAMDATAEAAYLVIPKKDDSLAEGCCTPAYDADVDSPRFVSTALLERSRPWLAGTFYSLNGGLVLALLLATARPRLQPRRGGLLLLLLGGLVSVPVGLVFLTEIAAPTLLHSPYHHCPYDLLPKAPETMAGVGLYGLGLFSIGWACVASWVGRHPETYLPRREEIGKLLFLALFGYLGALLMISVELLMA